MARPILPEGQTDADRIADFVAGVQGKNREQNIAAYERGLSWVLAYEVYRRMRKAAKGGRKK